MRRSRQQRRISEELEDSGTLRDVRLESNELGSQVSTVPYDY